MHEGVFDVAPLVTL